ncbi:hypothetical protein ACFYVD_10475 [Rhodococcus pyridinivorans]|uniref:hypothetical protein n=1 Tax=Rhodococcus pyridinivorans TaxID=103816 RepID=UPI0036C0E288
MSRNRKCPPVIPALPTLDTPNMPGALCAGQAPLHDFEIHNEYTRARRVRHAQAVAWCSYCAELPVCRAWAANTPRDELDGVIAGTVYPTPGSAAYRAEIGQEVAA